MKRTRMWFSFGLAVLLIASLAGNLAWAGFLRSETYRNICATRLSERIGLPSEIGRIVPLGRRAREYGQVVIGLPEGRGTALTCERAVVRTAAIPGDPEAYELDLLGGAAEISNRTWLRSDYRGVVESGLSGGFAPGGPRRITFGGMDVALIRDDFRVTLDSAGGSLDFSGALATANAACRSINGVPTAQPLLFTADISASATGIQINNAKLQAPRVALEALQLAPLLGSPVQRGEFTGELRYSESGETRTVELQGLMEDVELVDLTGRLPRPCRGRCASLRLAALRIENRRPVLFDAAGAIEGLQLADLSGPLSVADAAGSAALQVGQVRLTTAGVEKLLASGKSLDISLEKWTGALGWGSAGGTLRLRIDDLTIVDNRLASLDATFSVGGDVNGTNGGGERWIETRLLREVAARLLHVNLPSVLPERIRYREFGVRLEVRDEMLHVFGTHGEDGRAILSTELFGQAITLVNEPKRSFDLRPLLDPARVELRRWLEQKLERHEAAGASGAAGAAERGAGAP